MGTEGPESCAALWVKALATLAQAVGAACVPQEQHWARGSEAPPWYELWELGREFGCGTTAEAACSRLGRGKKVQGEGTEMGRGPGVGWTLC